MANITYPTQQLINNYLGYSSTSPNIGNNLGHTRNEPGFSVVGISNIPVIQNIYNGALSSQSIIGVDYPCLIEPCDSEIEEGADGIGKTVAIIGQDPRRGVSDKWYKNPRQFFTPSPILPLTFPNDVIFGLPWAANHLGYPYVGVISSDLVDLLLKRGFSIYFTDMFKLYNSTYGQTNYSTCMQRQVVATNAIALLNDELSQINPDRILVLGKDTFMKFTGSINKFSKILVTDPLNPALWVKHPAGRKWTKGSNSQAKAQYYNKLIF